MILEQMTFISMTWYWRERRGFFSLPHVELIVAVTIHEIGMRMTSFWVTVQIPCKRPLLPACREERPELCPTLTHTCWEKKDERNLAKQRRSLDKQERKLYAQTLVHCELEVICSHTTSSPSHTYGVGRLPIWSSSVAFQELNGLFVYIQHAAHTRDDRRRLWRSAACTHTAFLHKPHPMEADRMADES